MGQVQRAHDSLVLVQDFNEFPVVRPEERAHSDAPHLGLDAVEQRALFD